MNSFITEFFNELKYHDVLYCHFKSNNNLALACDGIGDLDLLISMDFYDVFNAILGKMKFRLALDRKGANTPFVFHYYTVDPISGIMVHLHVYFKLITGGSIIKNYWIPVEKMMLSGIAPSKEEQVNIPSKEADLILFIIRKSLEQPSIVEHYLFWKDRENINKELKWLLCDIDWKSLERILGTWVPYLPFPLFKRCLRAIQFQKGNFFVRIYLGIKIRKLFSYRVMPEWVASIRRTKIFFIAFFSARLKIISKDRFFLPGGRMVAFVGSEGSGKSTLSMELYKWLSQGFDVTHVHLGKPKKALTTQPVWWLCKLYIYIKHFLFNTKISKEKTISSVVKDEEVTRTINEPHPVIAFLDAIDRFFAVKKCVSRMIRGGIVITDRYPSSVFGSVEGPRINNSKWFKFLARIEKIIYTKITQPSLVFKVKAPLELTLSRNAVRKHPEPEDFVRHRYEQVKKIDFSSSKIVEINTSEPLDLTLCKVKQVFWGAS